MTTTKVVLLIQYSYKKIICRKIKSGLFDLQLFQKQKLIAAQIQFTHT